MNCPYCNREGTKVNDSREGKDGTFVKRRRECQNCGKRFSTIERVLKLDLEIKKSNGGREIFSLGKLKKGILKACEKRPVTLEQIDSVVSKILQDLKDSEDRIISSASLGKVVLKNLKELDEIAFLRFAIVHNNYQTMQEFTKEVSKLKSFKI